MYKKYVEITYQGEAIVVSPVYECSPLEYIQKKKAAEANFERVINGLLERIKKLENDVKVLKGED